MSIPLIDWDFWKQPDFNPKMKVEVDFPSGIKTYTDDEIQDISFDILAFENSKALFGAPTPGTGSIVLQDYEQLLNPTINPELRVGIKIRVYLGFRGYFHTSQLGSNVVASVGSQQQVEYMNNLVWAVPFSIANPLDKTKYYRLFFNYELEDGTIATEERTGYFSDMFYVPPDWPDNIVLALTYSEHMNISSLAIQVCEDYFQPYGEFFAQDWSYSTADHTATIDVADGMTELLSLDNRIDSARPSMNVNALTFLRTLLALYEGPTSNVVDSFNLQFSFYEGTQLDTITNLLVALMAHLFFLPDGTLALSKYVGLYYTGITLTDDDIYEYNIAQTASVSNDAAYVECHLPSLVSSTDVGTFSNLALVAGDTLPLSKPRIYTVDYLKTLSAGVPLVRFTWDVLNLYINSNGGTQAIFSFDSTYGWEQNSQGIWVSQNKGIHNSSASMYIDFTLTAASTLSWSWTNSSEINFDFINCVVFQNNSAVSTFTTKGKGNQETAIENLIWYDETVNLAAGTYRLAFSFNKDGSTHYGLDSGFVKDLAINGATLGDINTEKFSIMGTIVDSNIVPVYNVEGMLPYEIKDNHYIQTKQRAMTLVDVLDASFVRPYQIVTITLRGGYGLWVGGILHLQSDIYGIDADYSIIGLKFGYNGAIDTTLTLQRIS